MSSSYPYFDASGTSTAELAKTGLTILKYLIVENPNTTPVWIQLFDAAAISDVTVGTTTPNQTIPIPAGDGTENGAFADTMCVRFGSGLVYAVTTTGTGSGNPTIACPINMQLE